MQAVIDPEVEVFTFINTFHTSSERQAAIVESLRRFTGDVTAALPGFVSVAVHASVDGARVVNYVQWRSAADMNAMRGDPRFAAHMAEIGALADKIEPVVYLVVYVRAAG